MFLSVVIMAYNRKTYLAGAIRSVLDQTLPRDRFEIVLIKNFEDPEVEILVEKNNVISIPAGDAPIGDYIHTALGKTSGDVICFLDDDDTFERDKLQRVYSSFIEHPDLVYYKNEWSLVDQNDNIIKQVGTSDSPVGEVRYFDVTHAIRFEGRVYRWNMSCISVRKEILTGFEKFIPNIQSGQDLSLFYMAASKGGRFAHDPRRLTRYRWHEASMTKLKGENNDSYREYVSLRDLPGYVSGSLLKEDITRTITKLRVLSVWDGSTAETNELRNLFRTSLSFSFFTINDLKLIALSGGIYFSRLLLGKTAVSRMRKMIDPFWSYEGKF